MVSEECVCLLESYVLHFELVLLFYFYVLHFEPLVRNIHLICAAFRVGNINIRKNASGTLRAFYDFILLHAYTHFYL